METCANCPPGQSGAQTVAGARNKVPPAPLCPHAGYCISTRTRQSGGKGVVVEGWGGKGGVRWRWRNGRGEGRREEVAPISPDASLADGLPLLGKITPLVVRSPGRLYYLHGRAFIGRRWFWGGIRERMRNREEEVRVRQTALLFFTALGGASGDSKACEKAQGGRRCGKTSPSFF